jgi:hypothetical protein
VFGALRGRDKGCPQLKRKGKEKATLGMKGWIHVNNKDDDGHW